VAETAAVPAFDVAEATKHLAERDERLKRLIEETVPFQLKIEAAHSPYETLLEAVTHQSISGKAAATIFARVKALSSTGGIPTPQEMLKLRKPALRKAGLSAAKILAMKDLAQKTIEGVVPTLEQAQKLSDEELVKRLVSVRGIGDWTVEMFLIFSLGRPDVLHGQVAVFVPLPHDGLLLLDLLALVRDVDLDQAVALLHLFRDRRAAGGGGGARTRCAFTPGGGFFIE